MSDEKKKLSMFLRSLSEKGQGIVEFAVVLAFCVAIGYFPQTVGFTSALNEIFDTAASAEFAPTDIVAGETKVEGNIAAVDSIGGGSSSSDSGGNPNPPVQDPPAQDPPAQDPPAQDPPAGPPAQDPPAGPPTQNPPAGGGSNSTPGMPAGGQTGGGSGNTGSGSTFEEKKAALEAKIKASAVANGTAASYQLGAVVNDNGAYKIVINAGQGWNNLVNYRIIDVNEALKASSDGKHISMNGGDIVIADDGNAYINQYGHGWVSYPEDLYAQTSGCVKVKL